ncbi:tetratricopeptide repeat protein [Candidatus Tisiphia endosymbiont of Empis tessellata]|uniref:tetratricopeptide repeat protein n=1 Tax=Candidatus Tisiphia endosymbiont of Empis tessellata TaxID=3066259 RepID=UPI00313EE022
MQKWETTLLFFCLDFSVQYLFMKTRDEIKSEVQEKIKEAEQLKEQDISTAIGILEEIEQDLLPRFNINRSDKPSVKNTTQDKQGQEILYLSKCGYILYEIEDHEQALQHYNQFEERLPNNNHKVAVYKAQGDCLRKLAKHDEALEKYEKGITIWQKDNSTDAKAKGALYNNRGLIYITTEQYDKAIIDFTEAIKVTNKVKEPNPLYYCNKGKAFIAKGQNSDALEVFKEAENLIEKGHLQKLVDAKNLTKENVSYITNTLKLIIKDEDNVLQMQEIISGLDKNSPETQKFIKFFEKYKDVVTTVVFMAASNLDKSEVNTKSQEQLKLRFDVLSMENSDLKKELGEYTRTLSTSLEVVTAMQSKVQGVSDTVEYLKERFDSGRRQTLKDYDVVLEDYLKSSDLSEENKIKIKEYYKAFTGTIASLYITAQVVDSGQVETKKGIGVTLTASLLPLISISGDFVKITSEPILALIKAAITGGANLPHRKGR